MAVDLGYDESGETGGDTLIVSMQLGITKNVRRMTKLWKQELSKAGIPYFHSVDYKNYTGGVFRNLPRKRREHLLETLARYSRLRLEIGLTTKISQRAYMEKTDAPFRSKWATAYPFALAVLTLAAKLYVEKFDLGHDVNVLVEDGHKNVGQVMEIMKTLKETPKGPGIEPLNILSYGLGSKKDHPILQAADMLAFSEWQNLSGGDREIYNCLHQESRYRPELFECIDLVDTIKRSASLWEAGRKAWGQRKPRSGTSI
jgi:hypothetical protein